MASMIINELLCYVQNNFSKHPRTLVGVAINGFYTDEEVSAAKMCLHGILEGQKIEGLPRLIKRQASDNKRKLECDDILGLFVFADGARCDLPSFVAADLHRLPKVAPGDVDVYAMATSISALMSQVEALTQKVASLELLKNRVDTCECRLNAAEVEKVEAVAVMNDPTWAQKLTQQLALPVQPQPIQPHRKQPAPIRVKGSASQSVVKVVPRAPPVKLLKAFVGRLDPDTTEDGLRECLTKAGLKVVHCRKIKPPEGKVFKTAAFYVACPEEFKEIFYRDETWPDGVETRDWHTTA